MRNLNSDRLLRRAYELAGLIDGPPVSVGRSAQQIYQTMRACPYRNKQKWVTAVDMAARRLILRGYIDLVGPRLEMLGDRIYQEELWHF